MLSFGDCGCSFWVLRGPRIYLLLFSSFTWCGIGTVFCSYFPYLYISFSLIRYIYPFYVTYLYIPRHRLHIISLTILPSTRLFVLPLTLSLDYSLPTSISISFPSSHSFNLCFSPFSLLLVREQRSSCRGRPLSLVCYSPCLSLHS